MNERPITNYDAAEDFLDRCNRERSAIVGEFERTAGEGRISWNRLRAARVTRIWLDFGRSKVLRDEKGMDGIADQTMTLIARLYVCTELSGHTPYDARPEVEDELGRELTDAQWEKLLGMLEDEEGRWLLSDFAFRWLRPLYQKLYQATTSEEKLYLVDRVLNVVHQRSDLAGIFIEGGTDTLRRISQQGGYETPADQLDQKFLRAA